MQFMGKKLENVIFLWCPNPMHGMHDYHDQVGAKTYRCKTCGCTWKQNGNHQKEILTLFAIDDK